MVLVIKTILVLVVVCLVNMLIASACSSAGVLSTGVAMILIVEALSVVGVYLIYQVLFPLSGLFNALKYIDFESDVVDFSRLDTLQVKGSKEIKFIISKFKYLLDIITERINRVNSATYESEHDGLTGCYNRVRLDNMKGRYEHSQMVSIVFIDVNNLKRMNDEFGHEAGDALLRMATSKLMFWNTYGDVYRMGGDEFMIVLVNKTPRDVEELVKRWYPTVGQLNRDSDGFKCVLSYGIAHGSNGCNFDMLQKQADERMYAMKVAIKKQFGEPMR